MKNNILIILFLLLFQSLHAQDTTKESGISVELYLDNETEISIIYAKVYPVSTFVNGANEVSLLANCYNLSQDRRYDYLSGVYYYDTTKKYYIPVYNGSNQQGLNWDIESPPSPSISFGSVARGIYRIEFWKYVDPNYEFLGYTYYEIDGGGEKNDIHIGYTNDLSPYGGQGAGLYYRSTILGSEWGPTWAVSLIDYYIKYWDLYPDSGLPSRPKNYGNYYYGTLINPYNKLPLFANYDCNLGGYPEQNQIIPLSEIYNAGKVTLNITFKKDISTPIVWNWGNNTEGPPIIIMPGVSLSVSNGITGSIKFTMNPYSGNQYGTELIINPDGKLSLNSSNNYDTRAIIEVQNKCEINSSGILFLGNYSNIEIKNGGIVYLQSQSEVRASGSSKIMVYPGGTFCNYGAIITGVLRVEYIGGQQSFCYLTPDVVFDDSTQITLKDTCVFEIPDSTTVYFRNPESSLYLDSNSTLIMGVNSKLVFEDGAKLYAYKSKFKCSDTNSTWDGIYLSGFSNDTIKNCIIENASNGINIIDRYTGWSAADPSTEISNCNFKNLTNNPLITGIYIYNSNNILIRNNSFESPNQNSGFSTGILMEYCPAGDIDIISNNINYSSTGINVVQSSPYISRNSITGQENANYGIFLDNSNSIIKNNIINNFQNSVNSYYSSPYLFQNTLNNATASNIYLETYSTPLLGPVISSGSVLHWIGGNNRISGQPSSAGIEFHEESYPEMNDGFNIDSVNGSNYMTGPIPQSLEGTLNARNNFWGDSIPVANKFAVQEGTVDYSPTYDGVNPISYNNYDLTDIGFGLYDTVFTKNLSMSPGGNTLFMQAYQEEKQKDYLSAILLYKQVITDFKKSYFAAASVERIFNCLEKSAFNFIQFISHQNYLTQLRNNNKYPLILRELAEDYIIKCKIKRRLLNEALTDYQQMYEQNQNNPKGFHAFLNKESVLAMLIDTSRNSMISKFTKLNLHKINLLAIINQNRLNSLDMITGNENPESFQLFQNYPNPFNPITNIKYELPKDVFVSIKIYDIVGREIQTIVNDFHRAGQYNILFNGNNFASGVYFYRIIAGNYISVKRMLLIK